MDAVIRYYAMNQIPLTSNRDTNPMQYYNCEIENWIPPNNSSCWKLCMIQENTASPIISNDLQLQKGYDYKHAKMRFRNVIIIVVMCFGIWIAGNPGCLASLLCCEDDGADVIRNVIENAANCSQEACGCIFEDWGTSTTVVLLIAIAYCEWRF